MEETTKRKVPVIPLVVIGVIIVLVILFYFLQNRARLLPGSERDSTLPVTQTWDPITPTTEEEKREAAIPIVEVVADNYFFNPSKITVKANQSVKIRFTNNQGYHDFVIDELNIKIPITSSQTTEEITFTPRKKGTFEFYCSYQNHREQGMKGTIVVE